MNPKFEDPIENLEDFLGSDKVLVIKRSCKCIRLFLGWLLKDVLDQLDSEEKLLNLEDDFYIMEQLADPGVNQCRLMKESIGRYFESKFQRTKAKRYFHVSNDYLVKYIMGWNIKEGDDLAVKLAPSIQRLEESGVFKKVGYVEKSKKFMLFSL